MLNIIIDTTQTTLVRKRVMILTTGWRCEVTWVSISHNGENVFSLCVPLGLEFQNDLILFILWIHCLSNQNVCAKYFLLLLLWHLSWQLHLKIVMWCGGLYRSKYVPTSTLFTNNKRSTTSLFIEMIIMYWQYTYTFIGGRWHGWSHCEIFLWSFTIIEIWQS